MSKKVFYLCFLGLFAVVMTACQNNDPDITTNPDTCPEVSGSFPRKHLLEQFTGEGCGYCPYGMELIMEAIAEDTNYIWVANHYGYNKDEYTVTGESLVGKRLGVSYAPSVCLDRVKRKIDGSTSYAFHPSYLADEVKGTTDNTSFASVSLANNYDASSRSLHIDVKGQCENANVHALLLTVIVKESGMIGKQADYYNTWNGWAQFTHTKTIRQYVSAALGDSVIVKNGAYSASYDVLIDDKWNEDNCSVVAFLTWPNKSYQVINAAQMPVVEGTKGGEDIVCGGITMNAVTDLATETNVAPVDSIGIATAEWAALNNGLIQIFLYGDSTFDVTSSSNKYNMTPMAIIVLNTGSTSIADGVYSVVDDSLTAGNCVAGHHNADVPDSYTGTWLLYAYTPYLTTYNEIYNYYSWIVNGGEVSISGDDITYSFTTLRKYSQKGTYAKAAAVKGSARLRHVDNLPVMKSKYAAPELSFVK